MSKAKVFVVPTVAKLTFQSARDKALAKKILTHFRPRGHSALQSFLTELQRWDKERARIAGHAMLDLGAQILGYRRTPPAGASQAGEGGRDR